LLRRTPQEAPRKEARDEILRKTSIGEAQDSLPSNTYP
jgi:hypothetical protein